MDDVRIERLTTLPDGFDALRAAAEAEGFRHPARAQDDWDAGIERFEQPGEAFFAALVGGELAGVGGVTREPSSPASLVRARRFYVLPGFRSRGAGHALVEAVLAHARGSADRMLANSSAGAMTFWDREGFLRIDRPGVTHERAL